MITPQSLRIVSGSVLGGLIFIGASTWIGHRLRQRSGRPVIGASTEPPSHGGLAVTCSLSTQRTHIQLQVSVIGRDWFLKSVDSGQNKGFQFTLKVNALSLLFLLLVLSTFAGSGSAMDGLILGLSLFGRPSRKITCFSKSLATVMGVNKNHIKSFESQSSEYSWQVAQDGWILYADMDIIKKRFSINY